jgi:hypothetical protein
LRPDPHQERGAGPVSGVGVTVEHRRVTSKKMLRCSKKFGRVVFFLK